MVAESPTTSVASPGPADVAARMVRALTGWARGLLRLLWRDRLGFIGAGILAVFVVAALVALLAPGLVPNSAQAMTSSPAVLQGPSLAHPLGTDEYGRDLLARLWFGSDLALAVGVFTVAIAYPIGVLLGVVAGYRRGIVEEVIMRVTDMFLAFPSVLLAFVIAATLGRGTEAVIIAMAVSFWPWYTRLVHSQVLAVRSQAYVEAAVVLGLPQRRIILRHILPNSITSSTIQATMDIGSAILIGASLSWLGLGPQPPTPDWGVMFNAAYNRGSFVTFWWYSTFTGIAIFLLVLAFILVGDALRDALDPKLRRRRLF